MESFSSLKTERTARKVYRTRGDVKADVFDYITLWPIEHHAIVKATSENTKYFPEIVEIPGLR